MKMLKLVNNNQKGFTMIEVVIAIAITAIITGGIIMTIFQVFDGNTRSSNHMIAVRQVQNAGYWVSHDTLMALSVEPTADPDGLPLTLTWTDWNGDEHEVVYTLLADNELQREHYINYDPVTNPDPDSTIFVAEYINPDPAKTNCQFTSGELIMTVTATVGSGSQESSETRVYRILPRPSS